METKKNNLFVGDRSFSQNWTLSFKEKGTEFLDIHREAAHKVALQITSMKPIVANRQHVAEDVVNRELEVIKDKLIKENKPEKMIESITKGMLEKFYKEIVLTEQAFLFDDKINVATYLDSAGLICVAMARLSIK